MPVSLLHDLQAITHMLRSLDVLSNISDENNQSSSGDEHLLRGIHAEAGVWGVDDLQINNFIKPYDIFY